jgi:galactose-1-phosphate uridylyltransferase
MILKKVKKYFKLFSDNVKSKTVNCACGNPFDVQYAISASKPDIESYIKKSKDRLVEQTQSYCAMCRTYVINKESKAEKNKTVIVTTNKFPIVSEEDPNTVIIHVLCKQCLLTLKGDIMRMTREGKLANASKTVPLLCLICNKKVHQAELKYIKPIMKDGDGGCCTIL